MSSSILIYGEVLFDQFSDGHRILGGAPFNVAWNLQAFGLKPLFISRVGLDEHGKQIIQAMQDWGMRTDGIQFDNKYPTGVVNVTVKDGEPSYHIVNPAAYDFIDTNQPADFSNPEILYHGSLALRKTQSRVALTDIIQQTNCRVFVDINLRSSWWDITGIQQIMQSAYWLKVNADELDAITGNLPTQTAIGDYSPP
jgi:fructokinase